MFFIVLILMIAYSINRGVNSKSESGLNMWSKVFYIIVTMYIIYSLYTIINMLLL